MATETKESENTKSGRDFTSDELAAMKLRTMDSALLRHVAHCLFRMRGIANKAKLVSTYFEDEGRQFFYNLGRVQELLQPALETGVAGRDCWWRRYEQLAKAKDYWGMVCLTTKIEEQLSIDPLTYPASTP